MIQSILNMLKTKPVVVQIRREPIIRSLENRDGVISSSVLPIGGDWYISYDLLEDRVESTLCRRLPGESKLRPPHALYVPRSHRYILRSRSLPAVERQEDLQKAVESDLIERSTAIIHAVRDNSHASIGQIIELMDSGDDAETSERPARREPKVGLKGKKAKKPDKPEKSQGSSKAPDRVYRGTVLKAEVFQRNTGTKSYPCFGILLDTDDGGEETIWGVDLQRLVNRYKVSIGDRVTIRFIGRRPVDPVNPSDKPYYKNVYRLQKEVAQPA